jgi:galactofuranose transport system permease protein
MGSAIALGVLLLFNAITTPSFFSVQTLNVNLTQVATIVIVACGMTLVIATGGIDLSVGSLMAISGAVSPMLFQNEALGPVFGVILGFIVPVLVAGAFGLFNGYLVTAQRIQPIIATLVLFIAGRGIAQVITNGNLQTFQNAGFQYRDRALHPRTRRE